MCPKKKSSSGIRLKKKENGSISEIVYRLTLSSKTPRQRRWKRIGVKHWSFRSGSSLLMSLRTDSESSLELTPLDFSEVLRLHLLKAFLYAGMDIGSSESVRAGLQPIMSLSGVNSKSTNREKSSP